MKTLTRSDDNVALFAFADDQVINEVNNQLHLGDPVDQIIADCNFDNCDLHENVTNLPSDFIGSKYTYDGSTFAECPIYAAMMPMDEFGVEDEDAPVSE